ncbi:hypothetical protein M408DRAFT_23603 [Serendipita vermifera MAFF 305830]|uniref:F-box domain-containing protein n=1 Tax=Serendipita vermifera MAFF 305830 TaxID=933852 RepID=A0A0C3BAS8_SERVB|nr:hypothetical protein M408DRAFT_23603 [Serendipita vermifera MAFF 305830]
MLALNEHLILEIAQHLDVLDLLSFAHSCSLAFQISQLYSYWNPQDFYHPCGLSAFLPKTRVGPWRSYTGDELRLAATKLREFKLNWNSDLPVSTHRVGLDAARPLLQGLPGSRWLFISYPHDLGSTVVRFIDGKTGISTIDEFDISPPDTEYGNEVPAAWLVAPDEILVGTSGESEGEVWSFALSRIKLYLDDSQGPLSLKCQQTRLALWADVTPYPVASLNSQFLLLQSEGSDLAEDDLKIYHIESQQAWTIDTLEIRPSIIANLEEDWCIIAIRQKNEELRVVPLYLPSLLLLDESMKRFKLSETAGTVISVDHHRSLIDFSVSTDRRTSNPQYIVIVNGTSSRRTFDIQLKVLADSLYGEVTLIRPPAECPTDHELSLQVVEPDMKFIQERIDTGYSPFLYMYSGLSVLLAGYGDKNLLEVLYLADFQHGTSPRPLFWKSQSVDRRHSAGDSNNMDDLGQVQWIPYWNPSVGMILLREPQEQSQEVKYQICWF